MNQSTDCNILVIEQTHFVHSDNGAFDFFDWWNILEYMKSIAKYYCLVCTFEMKFIAFSCNISHSHVNIFKRIDEKNIPQP